MSQDNFLFCCPICKKGEIFRSEDSSKIVMCSNCNTSFKYNKKVELYALKKIGDKQFKQPFKEQQKRFENEIGLKAHEWNNISKGGLSDKEQKKYDEEQALIAEEKAESELLEKIQKGDLSGLVPVQDVPVLMKKDEYAYIVLHNISLYEEITKHQYVGGSRGVSLRVMKGVSFRVGAFKGERVPVTEQKHIDNGDFVVTNKRIIFSGLSKNTSFPLTKLISIDQYSDGISISREGKQRTEYYLADIEIPNIKHYSAWTFIKTVIEGIYSNLT